MCYKNMKAMVRFLNGNTDSFDIITGVFQRDASVPYLCIICLDYIL